MNGPLEQPGERRAISRVRLAGSAALFVLTGATLPARAGLGDIEEVLYFENFDTLSAAISSGGSPDEVNAQLQTVGWRMWSVKRWNHSRVRTIEDTGGGNMVVTVSFEMTNDTGGAPDKDLVARMWTNGPAYRDVRVRGYVGWNHSPSTYSAWQGPGIIVRAGATVGTVDPATFSGDFYFVRLLDNNDPSYGQDSITLLRVTNGVEVAVSGTVAWKNGNSNFNNASRRAGYLYVDIANVQTNVCVNAVFSTDPTFRDPTKEIITASWTDSDAARILTSGTVGFAHSSYTRHYDGTSKFTWDALAVSRKIWGTVVLLK